MYNSATGYNCVTTIKAANVGTPTEVSAKLIVQRGATAYQIGFYKYYAAVKASARDACVQYYGDLTPPGMGGKTPGAGRLTWGNCG